jgi:hypothetical protein
MAARNLEATGWASCYALKNGLDLGRNVATQCDPAWQNHQNKNTLIAETQAGAEVHKATPTAISFTSSHACNFRCTHCYQEDTRSSVVKKRGLRGIFRVGSGIFSADSRRR